MSAPYSEGGATMPSEIGSTPTIVSAPAARASVAISAAFCSSVAEVAGVFEEHGGGAGRELRTQIVEVEAAGLGVMADELDLDVPGQLGRAAVGPDHGEPLGAHGRGHEHVVATGEARGHPDRMPLGAAPAVDGEADEFHPDQLSELARELEPGLVAAVIRGGRSPDRGQELAPARDLVDDRRHVVLPDAAAEEAEIALAGLVAREQVEEVSPERRLGGERRRQVEPALEAVRGRDLDEEGFDVGRADGVEELLVSRRRRVRHVRVCGHAATL